MTASEFLLQGWTWNPAVLAIAAAALVAYLAAFRMNARFWYFAVAVGVFLLTLISPVATLADGYLFSAHMLQHILLLLVVPAFALLSLPRTFSLPRRLAALPPAANWLAGVGAMWIWHAPALCNAAVNSKAMFAFQTASLLVLGGAFWLQILAPREQDRLAPLAAIMYLFSSCVACSVLGIIFTLSPVTVCSIYMHPVERLGVLAMVRDRWGMSPEKDQQIGGLLMWVPMCLIYSGSILGQLARWYAEPSTIALNPGKIG